MKFAPLLRRGAAAVMLLLAATAPLRAAELPVAPVRNVPETFYGTRVDDPYRDFENVRAPAVAAWMQAHSEHAHATLRRIAGRDALRAAIERHDDSAPARVGDVVRSGGERLFYEKRAAGEDQTRLYTRIGRQGPERLLFDPETLRHRTGRPHAISYFAPSPDGRLVALGVSAGGSEDGSLRILDTRSGRALGPPIPRVRWGLVSWSPDGRELYVQRMQRLRKGMAATERDPRSEVVRMRPGARESELRVVLRAGGSGPVAMPPTEFPAIDVQPDGRVLASASDGVSPDLRLWHTTLAKLRAGRPGWQRLADRGDEIVAAVLQGDRLYAITLKDAPRGRLIGARLDAFTPAGAQVLLPESERVLVNLATAADGLYVEVRDGNVKRLLKFEHRDGARPREVPLPVAGGFSLARGAARADLPGLWFGLEGWTRARRIVAVEPDGRVVDTGLQPPGAHDAPDDLVSTEVLVAARDGVRVPMSIVHRRGVVLDGSNPTLLAGYASYGVTEEPYFSVSRLAWLDAGGVYAVANPRGSGVFGRRWHEAGRKANKPNSWRDFIACAEYLVAQGWTRPGRLGAWGGSAGGILVGRAMTERPDLFAAVVVAVGALDAVRFETTPNGIPNIPEFGSRVTEEGFRALLAMSTYHRIRDGVAYPAVLLTHGVNDLRVEVWNSTKTAARLMAASRSGRPVLLRLDDESGHGIGNTRAQDHDERADTFAFLLWQMAVPGYELR